MADRDTHVDHLLDIVDAVCDETASQDELVELDSILLSEDESRRRYWVYCWMHTMLEMDLQAHDAVRNSFERENLDLTSLAPWESDVLLAAAPSASPHAYNFLSPPLHNTLTYLSSGWPVAYLIATVIFAIGGLIGTFTYVSQPSQIARQPDASNPQSLISNPSSVVGQITGRVDCVFAKGIGARGQGSGSVVQDSPLSSLPSPLIRPGDKFALASGLMEITYCTGAKVILQGPCSYTVDSAAGGYLAIGKLTARMEKRGERREERGEGMASGQWLVASDGKVDSGQWTVGSSGKVANGQWPVASDGKVDSGQWAVDSNNPPSAIRHSPSSNPSASPVPRPASLFTITTPTATVTDLGTEFGVEVSEQGETQVHVLQGVVEARETKVGGDSASTRKLIAGEAVEIGKKGGHISKVTFTPQLFARKMPQPAVSPIEKAYMKAVLADRPMAYWPLNEPAGARQFLDCSGNGVHGYAMGKPIAGQPGPLSGNSRAVAFDGHSYIDFGLRNEFAMKNDFTIEAWVWMGNVGASNYVISALGRDGTQNIGWGLGAVSTSPSSKNDAEHPVVLHFSNHASSYPCHFSFPKGEAVENRWLHVAVAFDRANTAHFYIDGTDRGWVAGNKPLRVGRVWLQIGTAEVNDADFWQGRLAHIAVYPRVLSAEQIQDHYRRGTENTAGTE